MAFLEKERAVQLLEPLHDVLAECVTAGWVEWRKEGRGMPGLGKRARRNVVQDLIANQVRARLPTHPSVRLIECRNEQLFAEVGGQVLLRFKHFLDGLRTSNFQTKRAKAVDGQGAIQEEVIPSLPRLIVGWRLNNLETAIRDIRIAYLIHRSPIWSYDILEPELGQLEILSPQPVVETKPRTKRRVRSKQSKGHLRLVSSSSENEGSEDE